MTDYRQPKVTTAKRGKSAAWIGIALAVLLAILLFWWLWPEEEVETPAVVPAVPVEPAAPAVTPVVPAEPVSPAAPAAPAPVQ